MPRDNWPLRRLIPRPIGGTRAPFYRAFYGRILYKVGNANGPVAQGIEQQPSKLKVAGSNPAGVANKINYLCGNRHGHMLEIGERGARQESQAQRPAIAVPWARWCVRAAHQRRCQ